jgi:hypothetical protein
MIPAKNPGDSGAHQAPCEPKGIALNIDQRQVRQQPWNVARIEVTPPRQTAARMDRLPVHGQFLNKRITVDRNVPYRKVSHDQVGMRCVTCNSLAPR